MLNLRGKLAHSGFPLLLPVTISLISLLGEGCVCWYLNVWLVLVIDKIMHGARHSSVAGRRQPPHRTYHSWRGSKKENFTPTNTNTTKAHLPYLARVKVLQRVNTGQGATHNVAHVVEATAVGTQAELYQACDQVARVLQLCVWTV